VIPSLPAAGIRVVILDIEGTTTPVAFVHDVLFPFARARVRTWLETASASDPGIVDIVRGLRDEHVRDEASGHDPPAWRDDSPYSRLDNLVRYVHWLMDRDRKSHALKLLQGRIWEQGYQSGELRGSVYADVPPALERWTKQGVGVGIFSSGSVLAQKLLFANSTAGDLTGSIRWHFDTTIGSKIDAASYGRIASTLELPPGRILFVSDLVTELEAARQAGLQTRLCVRPPADLPASGDWPVVRSFDEL
jgi:enolase-phosphatase E1